jgi:hypothetical protein
MLAQTPLTVSRLRSTVSSKLSSALSQPSLPCALTWRDRKLFVRAASQEDSLELAALQDRDRLVECLKRSPVELVKLDSDLSPEMLLWWAEACGQAKKACYVGASSIPDLLTKTTSLVASLQGLLQPRNMLLLTIALGPIGLFLASLVKFSSLTIGNQWVVGKQGRLFQILRLQDASGNFDREKKSKLVHLFNVQLPNLLKISLLSNLDAVA